MELTLASRERALDSDYVALPDDLWMARSKFDDLGLRDAVY